MSSAATKAASPRQGGPAAAPQLETELGLLFRQAREFFRATAVDIHPELNVTGYRTLSRIVDEGPQRAATLADYFGTDKGSMSRQLSHLEGLGLVRRTRDPEDGRAHVVSATADAVRRTALARERSRERLRRRISGWQSERLDAFTALLHEFNAALTDLPPEPSR